MQSVYIETTIPSYLAGRPSKNPLIRACQQATRTWWDKQRHQYNLYTSQLVITEINLGDPEVASKRRHYLEGIPQVQITSEIRDMTAALLEHEALPRKAEADGLHIAIATIHQIDLLLTWNCRHIDNPSTKPVIRSVCLTQGYTCPEICTPIELLEAINHEE